MYCKMWSCEPVCVHMHMTYMYMYTHGNRLAHKMRYYHYGIISVFCVAVFVFSFWCVS